MPNAEELKLFSIIKIAKRERRVRGEREKKRKRGREKMRK